MGDEQVRYLAAMICGYSLFEFLLRRVPLGWMAVTGGRARPAILRGAGLFLTLAVLTSGFLSVALVGGYIALGMVYAVHEFLWGNSKRESPRGLEAYVTKQIVAGIMLWGIWRYALPLAPNESYTAAETSLLSGLGGGTEILRQKCALILSICAAYLFMIDGGATIVRGLLNKFPGLYQGIIGKDGGGTNRGKEENVGEWIGILERLITLTFVLTGSFTALAFALTAKSIARFKELEDKQFSEYYILGTTTSLLVALGAGMFIRIVFGL